VVVIEEMTGSGLVGGAAHLLAQFDLGQERLVGGEGILRAHGKIIRRNQPHYTSGEGGG
jgi:hypothetical protein